jgi:Uma2 family endonuclease
MPVEITKRRFDVDEYHRMGEAGILTEDDRVELIDGEIVAMTPIGPRHNASVDRLNRRLVTELGDRAIVRVQGSVRLDRHQEPQPDVVLLRPRADFYASRLPGPADILLIIEISESSAGYDRDVKARIYASTGVREYWLVDLEHRSLSRHTEPEGNSYRQVRLYQRGESIAPEALPQCLVTIDALLAD